MARNEWSLKKKCAKHIPCKIFKIPILGSVLFFYVYIGNPEYNFDQHCG